jgi:alkyl hydroperoxide reductase subunit D
MRLEEVKQSIGDYGKDVRLNLSNVLSQEGSPGLTERQIGGIALACAYASKNRSLVQAILSDETQVLSPQDIEATKAAASIMAMNNIYYRFLYLSEDKEFSKMPARLRMNVIGNPGVPKVDFELYSLALSALTGCGMCINAHIHEIKKAGITPQGIQSAVRIAAVINATAQVISISNL